MSLRSTAAARASQGQAANYSGTSPVFDTNVAGENVTSAQGPPRATGLLRRRDMPRARLALI